MSDLELAIERSGAALWLKLNRPHALNALTASLVKALIRAMNSAVADDAVRVIVLTGAGRAFCAGADLKESAARSEVPGASAAFIKSIMSLVGLLQACSKPVIAAVNGIAVAGGLELILGCDVVFAAESAVLGDSHSNFAMFPGGGATVFLPRKIGINNAKFVMFSGGTLPARDWIGLGLVSKVVEDAQLIAAVDAFAAQLAAKSPIVLARMKEALNDSVEQPTASAMRRERDLNELHAASLDRAEGLRAFREKRIPQFVGR
ncbi:enoyl-CoA hydratase [Bradyrhizobium genosp. SA-3]|uniref:enoyl-CoA hydratase/isomerase family protein n=1 Tax=Bradyrhizobium genosp. SA-3 TaxID=508868 RepID=UPI0010297A8B|nr:enoyl-CoA hydratase/isomerase family protein [Bradyrhizobium genosp. SA-3]RZN03719.1 enoyl-CoA hydratase [Bradyrhizobium genosp. SA-3]